MANDTEQHDEMKSGSAGEEMVLLFLFGVLLAGVLAVLYFDFRTLNGNSAVSYTHLTLPTIYSV